MGSRKVNWLWSAPSGTLQHHSSAQTASGALGDQRGAAVTSFQLASHGQNLARARSGKGMADRNRSTVDIEFVGVDLAYGGVPSYTPIILGGIIGAVAGNQFGSGSGQDWATVAGTTLGASIGNDYSNRRYTAARSYTTTERRCRVVNDYPQE